MAGAAAVVGVVAAVLSPTAATGEAAVALGVCRLDEAAEEGERLGRFLPGRECGGVAGGEEDDSGPPSPVAGDGDRDRRVFRSCDMCGGSEKASTHWMGRGDGEGHNGWLRVRWSTAV